MENIKLTEDQVSHNLNILAPIIDSMRKNSEEVMHGLDQLKKEINEKFKRIR